MFMIPKNSKDLTKPRGASFHGEEKEGGEESTPQLIPTIALPGPLKETSSLKEAKIADVQVMNDMLMTCYHALGQAKSLGTVSRFIDTTLRVVKARREVLCLQYGNSNDRSGRSPLDTLPDD